MNALADIAVGDQQSGRLVVLAGREDFLDVGTANHGFDPFRSPLASHFLGDVLGQLVDHVEIFHPHLLAFDHFARLGVGADVEADDRCAGSMRQHHIALGNRADAGMQHPHLNFLVRNLVERIDDRLGGSLDIGLDDHRIFDDILLGLHRRKHVLDARRGRSGTPGGRLFMTVARDLARAGFAVDHSERIAGHWNAAKAEHFNRQRRRCLLDLTALVVDHRTDAARLSADDEDVTHFQRAAIDQHRRQRALALVEPGLDHCRNRRTVRV